MLIISRNGQTTVVTGWRAWLLGTALFAATFLAFACIAFLLLGVAVTAGAVLLIVVPVAVGVALVMSFFRPRGAR